MATATWLRSQLPATQPERSLNRRITILGYHWWGATDAASSNAILQVKRERTTPMAHVIVQDLRKKYGAVTAVDGVSFEVEGGEIFGLIGPNGAGKTTTVECLLGLRRPDAGAVEICGIDALTHPHAVKEKVGAALQSTALQDKITPREALALFGGFYARRADPYALLERFGIAGKADAPFDTLSGGQRQRLALALAFVNEPAIVFLDEPTTGLDPQARRELHGDILRMKSDGHTVMLTTHYLEEAEQLCDRIAIIHRGRVIASGSPRELMARSAAAQSVTLRTSQPVAREWLERLPAVEGLDGKDGAWTFHSTDVGRTIGGLVALLDRQRVEISELHVQKASLEDVFLELTTTQ
jgi:ABC-2 type transport system ATP-binding protein